MEPVGPRGRDEALASEALLGCDRAWNEIVRRHSHRVTLALLAAGVPIDLAEDATQEAWLKLVERQRSGRLSALHLPGLAIAQARWIVLEAQRTQRRREAIGVAGGLAEEAASADVAVDLEVEMIHREQVDIIRAELQLLPARARQIFAAVYGVPGMPYAEVAREFGISLQRARQTVCEVRSRMRRVLAKLEKEEQP